MSDTVEISSLSVRAMPNASSTKTVCEDFESACPEDVDEALRKFSHLINTTKVECVHSNHMISQRSDFDQRMFDRMNTIGGAFRMTQSGLADSQSIANFNRRLIGTLL